MTRARRFSGGFTLLELAVVLGIIALIAGAGMSMATGALKAADRVTTQERLNTIKLALDSYAKTYGMLPCPANRRALPNATDFGVAHTSGCSSTQGASPYEVEVGSNVAVGAVPVRTLGLPDNYASDAWGNKLSYAVSVGMTVNPTRYVTNGGAGAAISIRFGQQSGSNFQQTNQRITRSGADITDSGGYAHVDVSPSSTGNLAQNMVVELLGSTYQGSYHVRTAPSGGAFNVNDPDGSTSYAGLESNIDIVWGEPGAAATYAVISHGPDGRGAFPMNDDQVPDNKVCFPPNATKTSPAPCATSTGSSTCIDIENCGTGITNGNTYARINAVFFDSAYNDGSNAATYFDDYVVWGSNANLRQAVNTNLYFSSSTHTCPTSGAVTYCEPWCARCEYNYPGGGTDVPAALTSGVKLCKKVITSNSSDCKAACFWSGVDGSNNHYKCP